MSCVLNTYRRLPLSLERGQGAWVWDREKKSYLDALAGIAVSNLGHQHPKLIEGFALASKKIWHCSNLYQIPEQEALAQKLCALTGMAGAFFCNSGAEAFETAFKLVRRHAAERNLDNPQVIVMDGAFHGRTFAALSASNPKIRQGFEPVLPGFLGVPYGDLEGLQKLKADSIAAVVIEPIQGEGGIRLPPEGFLQSLKQLCHERNWLLVLDEVQSGLGRTGRWWAHQHEGIEPDILMIAKGLANGLPIGATLVDKPLIGLLQPGMHGSTFGGSPFISSMANLTLDIIESEGLVENAARQGATLLTSLKAQLKSFEAVKAVRGRGLMLGIELDRPCRDILTLGLKHGLLFNVTQERVIRLLPPLIISDSETYEISARLTATLREYLG